MSRIFIAALATDEKRQLEKARGTVSKLFYNLLWIPSLAALATDAATAMAANFAMAQWEMTSPVGGLETLSLRFATVTTAAALAAHIVTKRGVAAVRKVNDIFNPYDSEEKLALNESIGRRLKNTGLILGTNCGVLATVTVVSALNIFQTFGFSPPWYVSVPGVAGVAANLIYLYRTWSQGIQGIKSDFILKARSAGTEILVRQSRLKLKSKPVNIFYAFGGLQLGE